MEKLSSVITRKEVCLAFRAVERVRFALMQEEPTTNNIRQWDEAYAQFARAQSDWLYGQPTG